MKLTPWLGIRHLRAADAKEPLFEELWRLRRSLINLKPEVTPEADYAAFRSYFADPDTQVQLYCTADGAIQGFFAWHLRPSEELSAPVAVADGEYYFVKPAFRDHIVKIRVAAECVARVVARCRRPRLVLVGVAYPTSCIAAARFSRRVRCPMDPDIEPWERRVLLRVTEELCGASFDQERGVVRMRTIPAEARRTPRSGLGRETLAWYESHNPRWTEGWGLPVMIHLSPGSVLQGALRLALARGAR